MNHVYDVLAVFLTENDGRSWPSINFALTDLRNVKISIHAWFWNGIYINHTALQDKRLKSAQMG
jgi:hypothetical protein